MSNFHHRGLSLCDAIDALKAYDAGALDSGIEDEDLREAVATHLASLDPDELRRALAECARLYLTDDAIALGYGLEDVRSLIEWLDKTALLDGIAS